MLIDLDGVKLISKYIKNKKYFKIYYIEQNIFHYGYCYRILVVVFFLKVTVYYLQESKTNILNGKSYINDFFSILFNIFLNLLRKC